MLTDSYDSLAGDDVRVSQWFIDVPSCFFIIVFLGTSACVGVMSFGAQSEDAGPRAICKSETGGSISPREHHLVSGHLFGIQLCGIRK
jgi:hypothetical protein